MIKDSGDRTEFETGAKRDMHAGKGRMDLLPWYGIMEVSKHCEEGALKYGEHNVDKGIPLHSLLDSASRHLAKYMVGMDDEDHLRAACWNLLWALNQRETHPELDDRFSVKQEKAEKKRPWMDGGEQITAYDAAGNRIWDGIWSLGSYGFDQGLIEVMGAQLLGHDDVEGWLTARQVTKMWRCRNAAQNR